MRIVVAIKQVPQSQSVKLDEATGTMIRQGVEAVVNPLDLYAIELALRIREQAAPGEHEVVAVSMGPPRAAVALREALAMGCDQAVLLSDPAFAGSDTWATSYVLCAAVRKLAPVGLVLCGERATDGDTGQVGPGLAAMLGMPVATYVGKLVGIASEACTVHRLVEHGHEVLEVDLPAVLTVVKEAAEPRLPTLRGKRHARSLDVPTWSLHDLSIDAASVGLEGSPTRVVRIFKPTVARQCHKLAARDEASVASAVEELVRFLKST